MVIDSSALIAIVRAEPEGVGYQKAIRVSFPRLLGASTAVEASIVMLGRFGERGLADLQDFILAASIDIVALQPSHIAIAIDAFRRFGKGRHAAGLNFGDCLSYALAKATNQPLLFKGEDFVQTDIGRVSA